MRIMATRRQCPLFKLRNPSWGDHLHTIVPQEKDDVVGMGFFHKGVIGRVLRESKHGAVPFYRTWNSRIRDHLYITDIDEFNTAVTKGGSEDEKMTSYFFKTQVPGTIPVYRFWNDNKKDHLYDTDTGLHAGAISGGWASQGIFPA